MIDFRKNHRAPKPLTINGESIEQVTSYKYLGVTITDKLDWRVQTDHLVRKCHQRLYFIRNLRSFKVHKEIMQLFHRSLIESVMSYAIIVWFNQLTVKERQKLQRIIRRAEKITGADLSSLEQVYHFHLSRKATAVMKDTTHPLHSYFVLAKSGRRLLSLQSRTNRLANSFIPSAVRFLNSL